MALFAVFVILLALVDLVVILRERGAARIDKALRDAEDQR